MIALETVDKSCVVHFKIYHEIESFRLFAIIIYQNI